MSKFARVVCFLLLIAVVAGLASAVRAAAIVVNTTADELNSDGDCSLREAIRAANLDTAVDACTAGSGADTITLPAGTYTLSVAGANEDAAATGDLDLASNLTLNGAGSATTTINANNIDRVFHITGAFAIQISGVTITGGNVSGALDFGGGIANSGTLTLTNSVVTNNTAFFSGGGVGNLGLAMVTNSTISNNTATTGVGGGISNNNILDISNSLISGNQALSGVSDGGGVANNGTATIVDSAITGNDSGDDGGGLRNFATMTLTNSTMSANTAATYGGGIANKGSLTVTASTVSGNTALHDGGGFYHEQGTMTLTNVTVSGNFAHDNGGGIYVNSLVTSVDLNNITITANTADSDSNGTGSGGGLAAVFNPTNFKNIILAGNTDTSGQAPDCSGTMNSQDHNLIQSTAGCILNGAMANNVAGQGANLGPLQNNGGLTFTHALLAGSPAIDAGDNATCAATDQRGTSRPQNVACDIGAYEMDTAATVTHTATFTSTFTATATNTPTPTSTFTSTHTPTHTFTATNAPTTTATFTPTFTFTPTATSTAAALPALTLPAGGSIPPTLRPLFDWSNVAGASSYTIQISANQNFTTLVLNQIVTPSAYVVTADLPRNTLLFWRVRANGPPGPRAWSGARHFFSGNPPGIPTLLLPANLAAVGARPTLDWSDSTPAANYCEVQISADPNFVTVLGRGQGGKTNVSSYAPETVLSSGVYYWRVRAVSGEQFSQWSAARRFSVP